MGPHRKWTKEEENILKALYKALTLEQIALYLPGRTVKQIKWRIQNLKNRREI